MVTYFVLLKAFSLYAFVSVRTCVRARICVYTNAQLNAETELSPSEKQLHNLFYYTMLPLYDIKLVLLN